MREADEDDRSKDAKTRDMLAAIWVKSRPVMEERVRLLRAAAERIQRTGNLPPDQHEAAISAAHNLAGVLGTFGFQDGTVAARKIELMLRGKPTTVAHMKTLLPLVATLERILGR